MLCGSEVPKRYLDDCYLLHFPWGLFGITHFYLGNYGVGLFELLSLGAFGILWLIDICLMDEYIQDANSKFDLDPVQFVATISYTSDHYEYATSRYIQSDNSRVASVWTTHDEEAHAPPSYDTVMSTSAELYPSVQVQHRDLDNRGEDYLPTCTQHVTGIQY